jgi:hypothetical protein
MFSTWATWGDLTIDCGREMYVPAVLSEGKMLYRDVWYLYGPAGPYVNSFLFRLFGVHFECPLFVWGALGFRFRRVSFSRWDAVIFMGCRMDGTGCRIAAGFSTLDFLLSFTVQL